MKKVLLVLLALSAFGSMTVYAEEELPEIAPEEEVAAPPIDAPAAE